MISLHELKCHDFDTNEKLALAKNGRHIGLSAARGIRTTSAVFFSYT